MIITFQVYQKPLFKETDHYELYKKNKKVFNSQQMMALRDLYAWRDEIARLEDESHGYAEKQIRRVFDDNRKIIFLSCPFMEK